MMGSDTTWNRLPTRKNYDRERAICIPLFYYWLLFYRYCLLSTWYCFEILAKFEIDSTTTMTPWRSLYWWAERSFWSPSIYSWPCQHGQPPLWAFYGISRRTARHLKPRQSRHWKFPRNGFCIFTLWALFPVLWLLLLLFETKALDWM